MSVDISGLEESEQAVIEAVRDFYEAWTDYSVQLQIGADTTEAWA